MLDLAGITEMAWDVARTQAVDAKLVRIVTEPTADSQGNDAWHIMMVLKPEVSPSLSGDEALDLLHGISRGLEDRGDGRLPLIRYATEHELAEVDGEDD